MSETLKPVFLLKVEIKDRYSQENFKRIEDYLNKVVCPTIDSLAGGGTGTSGGTTIIGGASVWEENDSLVYSGNIKTVDTIALANFNSLTYHITVYNKDEGKRRKFLYTVVNDGGALCEQISGINGSTIDYEIDAVINGTNVDINVKNNELYDLSISYARLID